MNKFKVGDRVRLKPGEYLNECSPDGVCTVLTRIEKENGSGSLELKEHLGLWREDRFELVEKAAVEKKLDLTKPVQTRDGRKARVICTDAKRSRPGWSVYALVMNVGGDETAYPYGDDGRFGDGEHELDLVNVPEKRWLNLYEYRSGGVYYTTEERAKQTIQFSEKTGVLGKYIKTIEVDLS